MLIRKNSNSIVIIISLHADPTLQPGAAEAGGGNAYSKDLLHELNKKKEHVLFITRKKNSTDKYKNHLSQYITIIKIDLGNWGHNDKDLLQQYHELAKKKIIEIIMKLRKKVKIVHSIYWHSGRIALDLQNEMKLEYVHTVLSNAKRKKLQNAKDIVEDRINWEKKIFENANYVICSSISESNDIINLYGIIKKKVIITGRYIHESFRNPVYRDSGIIRNAPFFEDDNAIYHQLNSLTKGIDYSRWWNDKNFIFIGRMHKHKGIHGVIDAWSRIYSEIGDETPSLWLVGGIPEQIYLMRKSIQENSAINLQEFEQKRKIIWWGTLNSNGISTLLLKSSVLIMNSLYEAGGKVIMEALSQGVPVIATPFGYAKDYIINWKNGFLIEPEDTDDLYSKMKYFTNQVFLSNYLGNIGRFISREVINNWDFINTHLKIYNLTPQISKKAHSEKVHNTINAYPFFYSLPSDSSIKSFVKQKFNENICDLTKIQTSDSFSWKIRTLDNEYLIKYFYTQLNFEKIWNNNSNEPYLFENTRFLKAYNFVAEKKIFAFHKPLIIDSKKKLVVFENNYSDLNLFDIKNIQKCLNVLDNLFSTNQYPIPSELNDFNIENYSSRSEFIDFEYSKINYKWNTGRKFSIKSEVCKLLHIVKVNEKKIPLEVDVNYIQTELLRLYDLSKSEGEFGLGSSLNNINQKNFVQVNRSVKILSPAWLFLSTFGFSQSRLILEIIKNTPGNFQLENQILSLITNNKKRKQIIHWLKLHKILSLLESILLSKREDTATFFNLIKKH